ncbi:ABC transporter permease [Nocardia yamanashiensis]|uniref:ABC transporter permease n=1 Tax=Nocardia yamanashiensis TaxID=209247 RepID=UPI001E5870B1|nr:ABC transporter permease [Nocardia yamanashiensis]UGT38956.1 ABC transporter permease [Nocardia yamanashiensis]
MAVYLLRRLIQAVVTVFVVVTLAFALGRLTGSPAASLLPDTASEADIAALNARLGFDKPPLTQYFDYLGGVLSGDFGDSYRQQGTSSMTLVLQRLPASLQLGGTGFLVGVALAFLVVLAIHLSGFWSLRGLALGLGAARLAVPDFLFGLLLVLVFSVTLGWLPSLASANPLSLVMPAVTIATAQFVVYTRLLDNSLTAEAGQDYVRTAYARGERRSTVILREMLPNALLPVLTVSGIQLGTLLGGLVIVETVFAWPGLGQLMLGSVFSRDFPVVQSGLVVIAVIFVVVNLCVDVLYGIVDPRARVR